MRKLELQDDPESFTCWIDREWSADVGRIDQQKEVIVALDVADLRMLQVLVDAAKAAVRKSGGDVDPFLGGQLAGALKALEAVAPGLLDTQCAEVGVTGPRPA